MRKCVPAPPPQLVYLHRSISQTRTTTNETPQKWALLGPEVGEAHDHNMGIGTPTATGRESRPASVEGRSAEAFSMPEDCHSMQDRNRRGEGEAVKAL